MSTSPYAAAPTEKLDEIVRLAEARLAAQLTIALAADQRAMTMASVLGAIEAAAIGGLIAFHPDHLTHWSLLVLALGNGVALGLAILAAQPVGWDLPGASPVIWRADIPTKDALHNGKAAMADHYETAIADNEKVMKRNGKKLRVAFWCMAGSLVVGAALAIVGA